MRLCLGDRWQILDEYWLDTYKQGGKGEENKERKKGRRREERWERGKRTGGNSEWKFITVRHTYCEMPPRFLLATDYSPSCWEGCLQPAFSHWLLQIQKATPLGLQVFLGNPRSPHPMSDRSKLSQLKEPFRVQSILGWSKLWLSMSASLSTHPASPNSFAKVWVPISSQIKLTYILTFPLPWFLGNLTRNPH